MSDRNRSFEAWREGVARDVRSRSFELVGWVVIFAGAVGVLSGPDLFRGRTVGESSSGGKESTSSRPPGESDGTMILTLAFSPDGTHLAVVTIAGGVALKDLATGQAQVLQRGPVGSVRGLAFAPTGRRIYFAGRDSGARSWDWESGVVSETLKIEHDLIRCVSLSGDGRQLAAGYVSGRVVLLDPRGGQTLSLPGGLSQVNKVAFSPDGRRLASVDTAGRLRLSDCRSGQALASVPVSDTPLLDVLFSPDGARLLTLSEGERVVRAWESTSGTSLGSFPSAPVPMNAIACSPDGSILVVARTDGVAGLLDAQSGKELGAIRVGRPLTAVAFSPVGMVLATGGFDGVARLWDLSPRVGGMLIPCPLVQVPATGKLPVAGPSL